MSEHPWFAPRKFGLLLGLLIAGCFPTVLFWTDTFFFRDYAFFSYPLAQYHKEAFWRGEIPLWNPYNNCGIPFLAQWNTIVLYPGSLIYLLLPLPWSLSLFCLVHFWLAGMGMHALVRSWFRSNTAAAVGGIGFVFCGLLLSSLKWPNVIAAFAWMPWIIWAIRLALAEGGRRIPLAALLGSMQMLTGTPEMILFTWTMASILCLGEQPSTRFAPLVRLARLALLVMLVSALCAAQLLPFLDLLQNSQRSRDFGGPDWNMPIWGWANFIIPLFQTFASYHGVHAQPGQYWISTYYVSLPLLLLAGYALRRRGELQLKLLAALAMLCAWMALGDRAYLHAWFNEAFPFLSFMRFPIKFVVPVCFILCLLGAAGLAELLRTRAGFSNAEKPFSAVRWTGVIVLLLLLGVLSVIAFRAPRAEPALVQNVLLRAIILLAAWKTLRLALSGPMLKPGALLVFALLIFADSASHAPWQNPSVPGWAYLGEGAELHPRPRLGAGRAMISPDAYDKLDHLRYDTPSEDVLASRLSLYASANLIDRVPKVDGFYSLYLRGMSQILFALYSQPNPSPALLDFLSISQYTAPGKTLHWSHRPTAFDSWASVGQEIILRPVEDVLPLLTNATFQPKETVYVVSTAETRALPRSPAARVGKLEITGHRWLAEVDSPQPTLLVLSQSHHPNWKATVNDQPSAIWRANLNFQGIPVPAGKSTVVLRYEDRAFKTGLAISGTALALVLLLSWKAPRGI